MASQLRSLSQIWLALGFGCLLGAAMTGGLLAWRLIALDGQPINRTGGFAAVMQREHKGYVLKTAGQSRISCSSDYCGYPSVGTDLGITRTYYMVGGRLIGVERDGRLIDLRDEIRASQFANTWLPASSATLSLLCFWAGMRARKVEQVASSRTSA